MDRNKVLLVPELVPWVALRKESVDRNCLSCVLLLLFWYVALRKESVDRNVFGFGAKLVHSLSLSARRAWIEIGRQRRSGQSPCVALRKESVDRNTRPPNRQQQRPVALRKESVDRNLVIHIRVCAGHNVALRKESVECFSF